MLTSTGVVHTRTSKCLLIGSGAREHCLAWKLAQSSLVGKLYCTPGNGGIRMLSEQTDKVVQLELPVRVEDLFKDVCDFCLSSGVDFVIVGPENPLCDGIADVLSGIGVHCFGPKKTAAILEGSKAYAKEFMIRNNIPTAKFECFRGIEQIEAASSYVRRMWNENAASVVIKASGLAAGKGVIVPETLEEALSAVEKNLKDKIHGSGSAEIIIEERLFGLEVSILALTDGTSVAPLPPSHDYKYVENGDKGPLSGGMGSVCPSSRLSPALFNKIIATIVRPTILAMKKEANLFQGCLYTGIMLTLQGPKVLEYNVRFGDPETQSLIPLIENDLFSLIKSCCLADGTLEAIPISLKPNSVAVSVVMASGGYPYTYRKGYKIEGLFPSTDMEKNVCIFHAGTKRGDDGSILTTSGRVLTVTAIAPVKEEALKMAYNVTAKLEWPDCHYRQDIGL
ncbi:putative Phosphoribosylamine--glycine ligase [Cardiosporidium cionae]|uniref:phosphoribosylamine--glycine ligase n=1 Tax=Cardiosporidium cionae TaxID=476202 RepID=A0ABQ7J8Z1_9APIC|nr:putative Phosphoribosylamine--glycine ligase [Cardiosporidium cionae]|eukprot:KAF8820440.1 putative Phosphoribosylamine--glycine ligase [Cardiosporidium cionae]